MEKPFGHDYESARTLNSRLGQVFLEEQIYRIDHYLGKETVQNLLVLRFANGIFEPLWNRSHVAEVQITVAETIGVETRGAYYEEAGALRDMMQNHLLQLLCLIALEPPVTFDAGPVHDEKNKVMRAIRPIDPRKVDEVALRGQYGPGFVGGKQVPGYRQEKGVAPDSKTETYAALRLTVDNWRWAGVPFYLRTGKRLAKRVSEIAIRFHRTPHMIFHRDPAGGVDPNELVIRIQPDEGVALTVAAKMPGPDLKLLPVGLDFRYGEVFGAEPPEAYERLLLDARSRGFDALRSGRLGRAGLVTAGSGTGRLDARRSGRALPLRSGHLGTAGSRLVHRPRRRGLENALAATPGRRRASPDPRARSLTSSLAVERGWPSARRTCTTSRRSDEPRASFPTSRRPA